MRKLPKTLVLVSLVASFILFAPHTASADVQGCVQELHQDTADAEAELAEAVRSGGTLYWAAVVYAWRLAAAEAEYTYCIARAQ
jgi:hypothetical protein